MKSVYVHQWNQLGERTLDAFIQTMKSGGVDEVRFKTHQYLTWTGHFDSGGAADIEDYGAAKRTIETLRAAGLRVTPWWVPMGLDTAAEAAQGALVANVSGSGDTDLEPYTEFWPAITRQDYSAVEPYYRQLRTLCAPGTEITLDFPARDPNVSYLTEWDLVKEAVRRAAPYVDRFALQSYFGVQQARDSHAAVAALGTGKPIDHIVEPAMIGQGLQDFLTEINATRLLIWRAADMDDAAYVRLRAIHLADEGPHPGPPPPRSYVYGGEAIPAAMRGLGDEPASDEQFPSGLPSYGVGKSGRLYFYTNGVVSHTDI